MEQGIIKKGRKRKTIGRVYGVGQVIQGTIGCVLLGRPKYIGSVRVYTVGQV